MVLTGHEYSDGRAISDFELVLERYRLHIACGRRQSTVEERIRNRDDRNGGGMCLRIGNVCERSILQGSKQRLDLGNGEQHQAELERWRRAAVALVH